MRRLGVIGAGGMAETLLRALADRLHQPLERLAFLVGPRSHERAARLLAELDGRVAHRVTLHADRNGFLAEGLELVAECASHAAVAAHGPAILAAGCDLIVISVGALADDALRAVLEAETDKGGGRTIVPAGAVGGLDLLGAARLSGRLDVLYRGRKPPRAWLGTDAERRLDLQALKQAATFFTGTAREAALGFPQNANVAAAVALAGGGFDATRVELIADPGIAANVHEIVVRSACADFTITIEGRPSPVNPKTSLTAGYSMARAVLHHIVPISV